jgi:hypothetical protein
MRPEAQALLCAKASASVYEGNLPSKATMRCLGFDHHVYLELPTTFQDFCALIASSGEYHILAFRGTKTPKDWITDLTATAIPFNSVFPGARALGDIHGGFGYCLADALQRLMLPLSRRDRSKPLLISGHSLGGALAALAGACFEATTAPVPPIAAIYTFGQPRVGLRNFCDDCDQTLSGKLVRFVNKKDIVPRVPFRTWNYSDQGKMIHFDATGTPSIEAVEWQDYLGRAFQCVADVSEFLFHAQTDVGNHSINEYVSLVQQNRSKLNVLLDNA